MLRRYRISKLRVLWWLPALPLTVAVVLLAAGNEFAEDWRIAMSVTGLACLPVLRDLACDASIRRRTDRQAGAAAKMLRDGCYAENWPVPPGLEDERTTATANVRELRPPAPHARHARAARPRP